MREPTGNSRPVCVNRRLVLGGLSALPFAATFSARARTGPPTVGYVSGGDKGSDLDLLYRESMLKGLAEQGFVAPDKLRWLERYAGSIPDRPKMVLALQALTRELVAEGADVIMANGGSTAPALAGAGPVPVVYGFSGDPVAAGIADSLARPRGNATGVTLMWPEANAKRIEFLKELAPGVRRIALISSPNHPGEPAEIEVCRRSVASLGIDMVYMPVFSTADLEKALVQAASENTDALVAPPDPVTNPNRGRLASWAVERRVPYASGWAMHADSGGLMTYGPSVTWSYQRVGYYAARVLGGAKPADLPIEQPSRFELVLNLRTAKAIGLKISDVMIERADRVIE
jgi:putative tryptophan/tyrosine transport system substrate-binding protein